ncbi:MAG: hypothetical protein LBR64_01885 [Dysgonamonadaceae bacterium]|jgi:hypothetical protein|nr:hypothetical protein [Dysgonamonadaceae bacterium]
MKLKLFLPVIFAVLALSSCTKYTDNYVEPEVFSKRFTVLRSDWSKSSDDSGLYYYCQFRVPELTNEVYNYGALNAYLVYSPENVEVLTPLPFNDYWVDNGYMWTEQVTCEFSPGYVTFILKPSDHADAEPYYDYDFLVRFLW